MSKITIDKAVLEQALSALEQINSPYWSDFVTPHIAQLREALAQPKQEPAAKVQVKMTGGNAGIATLIYEIYDPRREPLKPGDMLYASPQAQPQPVQEPVAPVGTVTRYLGNDGYMKWAFQPEAAAWLVPRDKRAAERGAESCFSVYTFPQAQAAHGIPKGTT